MSHGPDPDPVQARGGTRDVHEVCAESSTAQARLILLVREKAEAREEAVGGGHVALCLAGPVNGLSAGYEKTEQAHHCRRQNGQGHQRVEEDHAALTGGCLLQSR